MCSNVYIKIEREANILLYMNVLRSIVSDVMRFLYMIILR